jgi:tRNA guanosine-2'-O-methyltransferase
MRVSFEQCSLFVSPNSLVLLAIVSQNLLEWLRQRKQEGFYIVGLEQTSSSVSLANFSFPVCDDDTCTVGNGHGSMRLPLQPTVLLLGKEKEGIPVEFLQAVDHCIEIPQFGLIRSLNVHVSAAIAIWEFTKQGQLL